MSEVTVLGGGPAGAIAALSALDEGADVTLYEKPRFPRHKVCGEFLSGEVVAVARRTAA
jgi:flavin-dependent dehydrogenase